MSSGFHAEIRVHNNAPTVFINNNPTFLTVFSSSALRAAWSRDDVTLKKADVPDRGERLRTDWFTFRSPCKAQVADYYQAFAERVEHCVITFCEAIKRATDGHALAGSHLGALLDNGLHGYIYHQTSINMVRRALSHPAVDTFTCPVSYENRDPGGDATSMMAIGSLVLPGKIDLQDGDERTSLVSEKYRRAWILGRLPADMSETVNVYKRDVDEREVGCGLTEIREHLSEHDTRVYFLGDADAYRRSGGHVFESLKIER